MMKKTILSIAILLATSLAASSTKQELVRAVKDVDAPLWHQTMPAPSADPALLLTPLLSTLPGLPATSTLFFSRTPVVSQLTDLLNDDALHRITLNSLENNKNDASKLLSDNLEQINVQEHTLGLQLGQQWHQDNWEVSWNWWLGMRERNMWLAHTQRKQLKELLKGSPVAVLGASPWRSSVINVGVGDVNIAARYRISLGQLFSFSLGVHTILPTATKFTGKESDQSGSTLPLDANKFSSRLAKRARQVMLTAPFGTNGGTGIGLSSTAQLNITEHLKFTGELTSVRFRPSTQYRYALAPSDKVPFLVEGDLESQAGMSPDDDITGYLEHYLYPRSRKVKLTTGALHTASAHICYTTPSVHTAFGYRGELHEPEQSESAPEGTLRLTPTQQHQITGATSISTHYDWGTAASYVTAHYTVAGTHAGSWSIGFGATVQA